MRVAPAALVALILLVLTPAAHAERGPCVPGTSAPTCEWWDAKVDLVADGDTIEVKVDGKREQIRFTGINAMELSKYSHTPSKRRGSCHGLEATAFAERYIKAAGWKVRLAAQSASSRSGRRLRRSVWVRSRGRLVDLARLELKAGHALWLPNDDETAHNTDYGRLAAEAIRAGRNLYDSRTCGVGPDQDLPIDLVINWDADGGDAKNLNGEWVDIRNDGARPLNLGGWWLRDSALRYTGKTPGYVFPAGTVVDAGRTLRLYVGCGQASATEQHWCLSETVFENVQDAKGAGDGAYLFDPQGDLRASAIYPCMVACVAPLQGLAKLIADPKADTITIVNTGGAPIDLGDHVLKLRNHGLIGQYVFGLLLPLGAILDPGGTFTYPVITGLAPNGGVVELRTADDQLVDCFAWGFGKC
jgi:endonuclease YncB( thermonuclease family)